jgi:heterodisulfide reductase subunit B
MRYIYYPGCSLEGTATEYNTSTRAVMRELGAELPELDDWTCCGASAGDAQSYLLSMVLPARNLALAQRSHLNADFLIPCSACYLSFKKVEEHIRRDEGLLDKINQALSEEDLSYSGGIRARHLLDVLANDMGAREIEAKVRHELKGIRVAPYYGCQCLRPYQTFDDPERPTSMEPLIEALGAEVHPWEMGARCCGAGLMTTKKDAALELVGEILSAAGGADCIATVCPMCQMNLESFQGKIARLRGEDLAISVVYLPQLIGLSLGLPEEDLKLKLNMALTASLRHRFNEIAGQA